MIKPITLICGIALAVAWLIALPCRVYAADTVAASDKAAITALEARFAEAVNAKDVNTIMRVYAPGQDIFVFDVTPPRQYVGWSAVKTDWEGLLKSFPGPLHISISDLGITVVGPVAYGHSIQRFLFTRANGSKVDNVIRTTDVYRKINGRWLIVQEHASVPVDAQTGKADWLSRP